MEWNYNVSGVYHFNSVKIYLANSMSSIWVWIREIQTWFCLNLLLFQWQHWKFLYLQVVIWIVSDKVASKLFSLFTIGLLCFFNSLTFFWRRSFLGKRGKYYLLAIIKFVIFFFQSLLRGRIKYFNKFQYKLQIFRITSQQNVNLSYKVSGI